MVISERDFDGPLKYNRTAEVHWGDAIVYSDITSPLEYDDKGIDGLMIDNYKEVLERKIEVCIIYHQMPCHKPLITT